MQRYAFRGIIHVFNQIGEERTMSPTLQELGIDRLSAEDRLSLAEAILESIAHEADQAALPESQRKELERRLADSIARLRPSRPGRRSRRGP